MAGSDSSRTSGQQLPLKNVPSEKLPQDLQKIVDDDDSLMDQIYDGKYVTMLLCPK